MSKKERNQNIVLMLKNRSLKEGEAGKLFGVSQQRISQIVRDNGLDRSERVAPKSGLIERSELLGKVSDKEVSRRLRVSPGLVWSVRKQKGIKAFSVPVGCEECGNYPYAKGLCRNCYEIQRRRKLKS